MLTKSDTFEAGLRTTVNGFEVLRAEIKEAYLVAPLNQMQRREVSNRAQSHSWLYCCCPIPLQLNDEDRRQVEQRHLHTSGTAAICDQTWNLATHLAHHT